MGPSQPDSRLPAWNYILLGAVVVLGLVSIATNNASRQQPGATSSKPTSPTTWMSERPVGKVASWEQIEQVLDSPEAKQAAQSWGYASVADMRAALMQIKALGFAPDPGGNGWIHPDGRRVDRHGIAYGANGKRLRR